MMMKKMVGVALVVACVSMASITDKMTSQYTNDRVKEVTVSKIFYEPESSLLRIMMYDKTGHRFTKECASSGANAQRYLTLEGKKVLLHEQEFTGLFSKYIVMQHIQSVENIPTC